MIQDWPVFFAVRATLSIVVLIGFLGCAKSEMVFHFAAIDANPKTLTAGNHQSPAPGDHATLKFYRVRIKGESMNGRADLQTGFYNADALHQLFGDVSEENAKSRTNHEGFGQVIVQYDPASGQHRIIKQDQRFTVVFGSNSDAVSEQIASFASASDTGKALGSLIAASVGKESLDSLHTARSDAEIKQEQAQQLTQSLKGIADEIGTLPTDDPAAFSQQLRQLIRKAMQKGLRATGSNVVLSTNDFNSAVNQTKGAHEHMEAGHD